MSEATAEPRSAADHAEADATAEGEEAAPGGHLAELGRKAREMRESDDSDVLIVDDDALEAREAAASGNASEDDWDSVTEWLLGDTVEAMTRKLSIRVGGTDDEPRMMPWIIKAIPIDVIRMAERDATGNQQGQQRRRRPAGAPRYDELKANLRVIVEGTVKPDLKQAAQEAGIADPTVLLQRRLAMRVGVVAQIAGEIMSLSGFDESDVQAAGN
jgi:hypothetical protein